MRQSIFLYSGRVCKCWEGEWTFVVCGRLNDEYKYRHCQVLIT